VSGQATGWVLRNGPKDRAMRAVLVTIADAANADGCHAHPGMRAMVEGSLYSERSVQGTIAKLVRDGWVEIEEAGGGRGKATVFRVVMETPQSVRPSLEETPQKPRNLERETPQSGDSGPLSTTYSTTTDDPLRGFDLFWQNYPRRNGTRAGRKATRYRWVKLSYEDKLAAFRGLDAYKASVGEFPKDPERYLSGRLWEDDRGGAEPEGEKLTYGADWDPDDPRWQVS
jgi:hypothetical protein